MVWRRNVLIFHLGALGDFVLTWPLAMALARLHPQSRVFYVTHQSKGQLAEKALRIDSTDIEGGWHALFSENASLAAGAGKLLSSAHTVVSFLSDGQDAWADNIRRLQPEANLVCLKPPTLNAPPVGEHAAAFIEKQLAAWPALRTAVQQILRSIADRGVGARAVSDGSTVIHPGSGAAFKCWPIDRFVELANRLAAEGRQVKFVIGEVERDRWAASDIDRLAAVGKVEQPADPVALWKIISAAAVFVGNDSGPAHLAGMAGVPTVVIFGATSPEVWKPLGPRVAAVRGEPIESVTMEQVLAAMKTTTG